MNADRAHDLACSAFVGADRVRALVDKYGDRLWSSLSSPSPETGGRWVEVVQLQIGEAVRFLDDTRGFGTVVARCEIDPASGECVVTIEEFEEPDAPVEARPAPSGEPERGERCP